MPKSSSKNEPSPVRQPMAKDCKDQLIKELIELEGQLNLAISVTPTGPARNHLCDMNIHRLAAIEELEKL